MELLLGGLVDSLGLAVGHWDLDTFLELDLLAVGPRLGLATGGVLHLAVEGVGHPDVSHLLGFVIPDLLAICAVDLGDDELDRLGDEFALLPGDRLTGLVARPLLLALRVCLPERDAVLLGHVPALGQHLHVGDHLPTLHKKVRTFFSNIDDKLVDT